MTPFIQLTKRNGYTVSVASARIGAMDRVILPDDEYTNLRIAGLEGRFQVQETPAEIMLLMGRAQ